MPQDGSVGPLSYPQDVQEALTSAIANMNNSTRALRHVSKACQQQTSLLAGNCLDFDDVILKTLLFGFYVVVLSLSFSLHCWNILSILCHSQLSLCQMIL